jgi:prevent-host-death family protein
MKTVGSRELKNRLGRYLGLVRRGETIIVTDRGKTVAHLTPPTSEGEEAHNLEDLLRRLEAEGHLRLAKDPFKRRAFKPIVTRGKPASQMVMEDRE